MDNRQALQPNTCLTLKGTNGNSVDFYITGVVGLGGSNIVYDGYYLDNLSLKKAIRIKECYPVSLSLRRDGQMLVALDIDQCKWEQIKSRQRNSYIVMNELWSTSRLTNSVINTYDIYEANNTVYVVSSYVEGQDIKGSNIDNINDIIKVTKSVARAIDTIHSKGYLYLDIKPENVLLIDETKEIVFLYDFDSLIPIADVENGSEYRLSYSEGFAPVEQKIGQFKQIGKSSDVYSLGALMFYMIWHRSPTTFDCGDYANYDYSKVMDKESYQDKLFIELNLFFSNTLQSFYKDRYQSMSEAISQLDVLLKLSDKSKCFVRYSSFTKPALFVGRVDELASINEWLISDSNIINVYGMGGIGKSTLIRYAAESLNKTEQKAIYINADKSLLDSLADDNQLIISNCERYKKESLAQYAWRKVKILEGLIDKGNTLLIIDNYDEGDTHYVDQLLSVGFRVIIISRKEINSISCERLPVSSINHKSAIDLYEGITGLTCNERDQAIIDEIYNKVQGHTLIMEMIFCQINKSYLTLSKALELVTDNGFSLMAEEKINYNKDGRKYYGQINNLLKNIYSTDNMSSTKISILKVMTLYSSGVDYKHLYHCLKLSNWDDINELMDDGWINREDNLLTLHPLINELISNELWDDNSRQTAFIVIDDMINAICRLEDNANNYSMLQNKVNEARSIIRELSKDSLISNDIRYKNLLYEVVVNSPNEYEEFIINNATYLINDELFDDKIKTIELYDYLVYVINQSDDYERAKSYIDEAYVFAQGAKDNYVWGKYYDLLGAYYDNILSGYYDYQTLDEKIIFDKQIEAMAKSIHYYGKSQVPKAFKELVRERVGLISSMIRQDPTKKRKIRKLIEDTSKLVESTNQDYPYNRHCLNLARGWFYVYVDTDVDMVRSILKENHESLYATNLSLYEHIVLFYIPAANMMFELHEFDIAYYYLDKAISICDKHKYVEAFYRLKRDLLTYKHDVAEVEGDTTLSKELFNQINSMNKELDC